jgi:cytoskeleton protein RodZ
MRDQDDWRALEREATPGRAVGRLLREEREARGLSVLDVEKQIRIRHQQIEAIEEGRFDRLPGAAYIPAFLRAYATHLSLDADKVLAAYHLSGAVPIKRPVALPADFPIVDKRPPIGLAVLTALLVVVAGYVVWHYLPRQQTVVAEKVPPVPDRLLATPQQVTETKTTAAAPAATVTSPPKEVKSTLPPDTWPASRADAGAPSAPPPAPPIVVAVPTPPPPVVMSAPAAGQAQAAQPAPEAQEARTAAPEPAPPVQDRIVPTRVDTPVAVRANSWVELRAPNGDVLTRTYVRAGESYVVPAGIAYRVIEAR